MVFWGPWGRSSAHRGSDRTRLGLARRLVVGIRLRRRGRLRRRIRRQFKRTLAPAAGQRQRSGGQQDDSPFR